MSAAPRDRWLRVALGTVTLLAGGLWAAGVGGPLLGAVMIPFVLLCPGLAWSRHLSDDLGEVVGFGIAISVSLAAVVGQVMALVRWWSPGTGFVVLAAATALGAGIPRRPEPEGAEGARQEA